jgi:hypothetical protein
MVVGTHQRGGVARLASVSRGALHFGRMAVACIPPAANSELSPGHLPDVRRILIPTDFSPMSNRAIPYGLSLAPAGTGEVFLLARIRESRTFEPRPRARHRSPPAGGGCACRRAKKRTRTNGSRSEPRRCGRDSRGSRKTRCGHHLHGLTWTRWRRSCRARLGRGKGRDKKPPASARRSAPGAVRGTRLLVQLLAGFGVTEPFAASDRTR